MEEEARHRHHPGSVEGGGGWEFATAFDGPCTSL